MNGDAVWARSILGRFNFTLHTTHSPFSSFSFTVRARIHAVTCSWRKQWFFLRISISVSIRFRIHRAVERIESLLLFSISAIWHCPPSLRFTRTLLYAMVIGDVCGKFVVGSAVTPHLENTFDALTESESKPTNDKQWILKWFIFPFATLLFFDSMIGNRRELDQKELKRSRSDRECVRVCVCIHLGSRVRNWWIGKVLHIYDCYCCYLLLPLLSRYIFFFFVRRTWRMPDTDGVNRINNNSSKGRGRENSKTPDQRKKVVRLSSKQRIRNIHDKLRSHVAR